MTADPAAWKAVYDSVLPLVSLLVNAVQWLDKKYEKRRSDAALASLNDDRVRLAREATAAMRDAAQLAMLSEAAKAEPPHKRKAGP